MTSASNVRSLSLIIRISISLSCLQMNLPFCLAPNCISLDTLSLAHYPHFSSSTIPHARARPRGEHKHKTTFPIVLNILFFRSLLFLVFKFKYFQYVNCHVNFILWSCPYYWNIIMYFNWCIVIWIKLFNLELCTVTVILKMLSIVINIYVPTLLLVWSINDPYGS